MLAWVVGKKKNLSVMWAWVDGKKKNIVGGVWARVIEKYEVGDGWRVGAQWDA